jgi:hypothetical protein
MLFFLPQGLAYIHQHGYFHRDMKPGEGRQQQGEEEQGNRKTQQGGSSRGGSALL